MCVGTGVLHHLSIVRRDLRPELCEDQCRMSERLLRCQLVIGVEGLGV